MLFYPHPFPMLTASTWSSIYWGAIIWPSTCSPTLLITTCTDAVYYQEVVANFTLNPSYIWLWWYHNLWWLNNPKTFTTPNLSHSFETVLILVIFLQYIPSTSESSSTHALYCPCNNCHCRRDNRRGVSDRTYIHHIWIKR